MREAIDFFLGRGYAIYGLTLMQTYSEFMYAAPDREQRRHKFRFFSWTKKQDELIQEHLGVRRRVKIA